MYLLVHRLFVCKRKKLKFLNVDINQFIKNHLLVSNRFIQSYFFFLLSLSFIMEQNRGCLSLWCWVCCELAFQLKPFWIENISLKCYNISSKMSLSRNDWSKKNISECVIIIRNLKNDAKFLCSHDPNRSSNYPNERVIERKL